MNKGLKFSFPPFTKEFEFDDLAADLEIRLGLGENSSSKCADFLQSKTIPTVSTSEGMVIKKFQKKIDAENLVISKADKGASIVVMNQPEYVNSVINVLESSAASVDSSFNFSSVCRKVRVKINASKLVIPTQSIKDTLLVPNPVPPRLYGLPSFHMFRVLATF